MKKGSKNYVTAICLFALCSLLPLAICGHGRARNSGEVRWKFQPLSWASRTQGVPQGPDLKTLQGTTQAFAFDAGTKEVQFGENRAACEYKFGTNVKMFAGWAPDGSGSGVVRWCADMSFANEGWVFTSPTTYCTTVTAPGTDRQYAQFEIADIVTTGITLGGVISVVMYRDATHAEDTFASDAFLILPSFYFEVDDRGCQSETVR